MPIWNGTSSNGISAPIGIKGTGNPMELSLGLDPTKVNTLIAGTTGSGKSNLLHVLIMSFALKYSPEELIFYLIDFKEGVEFIRYSNLPHVEVLGVESDSEYGLAILTKLVNEKDTRMHKFGEAGQRGISSYRFNHPRDPVPRIMVIFDEYQKLLEDERIKSEALMKIEDLARTGRAAGIHLIFSTQTISPGLLNNATLGQFRMRIALRCNSHDDSERIIGNNGAIHLQKLGFAIFTDNPAGGVQYNNEFMVAMAPSMADYNRYIDMMNNSPVIKNYNKHTRVFRGYEPVKLADYKDLFLSSNKKHSNSIHAWLGEPIEIASPLAAEFNHRLGDNLAIIITDVRDAYGMILSSLSSILTQSKNTRVHLLDSGITPQYSSILGRIAQEYPDNVFLINQDALSNSLKDIADQSSQKSSQDSSMIFIIIVGLQKFLTLRAPEEYLQHSYEDRQSLNHYFIRTLKEGPEKGIHTIVWCDSYRAFKQYFPNPGREIRDYFNFKVAGTMGYEDSNNFIQDSIAIKKINRPHRAIYYSNGVYTLFRPFDADYKL